MNSQYKTDPLYREKVSAYHKKRKEGRKRWLSLYKMAVGCSRCGYDEHPVALDFHHVNPKEKSFDINCSMSKNLKVLINEVKKCIVVCSNCHRILHMEKHNGT